jgi:hypothetical protein
MPTVSGRASGNIGPRLRVSGEVAGEPAGQHPKHGRTEQERARVVAGIRLHVIEHVTRFALVQPLRSPVHGIRRMPRHLGCRPGLSAAIGHRAYLVAEAAQPGDRPLLLYAGMLGKLRASLAVQIADLSTGLGGDMGGLIFRGLYDIAAGLDRRLADRRGLLFDMLRRRRFVTAAWRDCCSKVCHETDPSDRDGHGRGPNQCSATRQEASSPCTPLPGHIRSLRLLADRDWVPDGWLPKQAKRPKFHKCALAASVDSVVT